MNNRIIHKIEEVKNLILKRLNLTYCELTEIPKKISEIIWIESLKLNGNINLTNIKGIDILKNLKSINLSNTSVKNINDLSKLTNLRNINLSKTRIFNLQPLSSLKHIKYLNLSNTEVYDLYPVLHLIKKGLPVYYSEEPSTKYGIIIKGSPVIAPPIEIIQQGNKSIINYFNEIAIQGSDEIYESKLLIIGEGGVGKTTLAKKLIDHKAKMPKAKDTTKGINILRFNFTAKNKKSFRVNIWDFGGQEIYHATHQFFMTKRSLYILVDDTRKDDRTVNDAIFNYWLHAVELYGDNSPLLIVQNEIGDRSKQIEIQSITARFKNVINHPVKTNLLTCRGLDELENDIQHYIQKLPHIGEKLPRQWVIIRRHLEEASQKEDYISYDKYLQICTNNGISNKAQALYLINYLHDIGICLYYQDKSILERIVILNNAWATNAVYKILNSEYIKEKNGIFTWNDIEETWFEEKYRYNHHELIALMVKFELCYELKDNENKTWLAPQLLRIEKPNYKWHIENNITLKFSYDFMPKGLLSRFIVRMHRYLTDINKAWRGGVVLEKNKTLAQVMETYGRQEIVINVQGVHQRELMTIILEEFDRIHNSYPPQLKEKLQTFIPCNCSACKDSLIPYFYIYENLLTRKERGKEKVECEKSYDEVSVTSLLEGVFTKQTQLNIKVVRSLISKNQLREVLDLLKERFPNDVAIISGEYEDSRHNYDLNAIKDKEWSRIQARIRKAILNLLEIE